MDTKQESKTLNRLAGYVDSGYLAKKEVALASKYYVDFSADLIKRRFPGLYGSPNPKFNHLFKTKDDQN